MLIQENALAGHYSFRGAGASGYLVQASRAMHGCQSSVANRDLHSGSVNSASPATHRRIILVNRVLNVILSHQSRDQLERLLAWWSCCAPVEDLLIAYGGQEEEFKKLPDVSRVFVSDPRLRVDKTRKKQSYSGVWRAAAHWLTEKGRESFTHVYFAEFDHLPIVPDLAEKLLDRAEKERADVLGHGLRRVDGTSNVHYLYHLSDPAFLRFWRRISVRPDKEVVLHMVATGSFWRQKAFMDVAAQGEEISAYLEIYLPTLAHHLGFRLRDFGNQEQCVSTLPIEGMTVDKARRAGCWTVHPIKRYSSHFSRTT